MNTASAQAGPFTVAPKAPSAHIITPLANTELLSRVPLRLQGSGFDHQGVLSDAQFAWASNGQGALGTGRQLTAWNLTTGRHTLTLTVTAGGLTGQDSVQVEVLPAEQLYLPLIER